MRCWGYGVCQLVTEVELAVAIADRAHQGQRPFIEETREHTIVWKK